MLTALINKHLADVSHCPQRAAHAEAVTGIQNRPGAAVSLCLAADEDESGPKTADLLPLRHTAGNFFFFYGRKDGAMKKGRRGRVM